LYGYLVNGVRGDTRRIVEVIARRVGKGARVVNDKDVDD
jgi:hypothetical protein